MIFGSSRRGTGVMESYMSRAYSGCSARGVIYPKPHGRGNRYCKSRRLVTNGISEIGGLHVAWKEGQLCSCTHTMARRSICRKM